MLSATGNTHPGGKLRSTCPQLLVWKCPFLQIQHYDSLYEVALEARAAQIWHLGPGLPLTIATNACPALAQALQQPQLDHRIPPEVPGVCTATQGSHLSSHSSQSHRACCRAAFWLLLRGCPCTFCSGGRPAIRRQWSATAGP